MFNYMDTNALLIMGLIACFAGFFGGMAMNGVLEDDGFGVIGNMLILIAGALIGIQFGQGLRIPFEESIADAVRAITGAFLCLSVLAVAKNVLRRFGL